MQKSVINHMKECQQPLDQGFWFLENVVRLFQANSVTSKKIILWVLHIFFHRLTREHFKIRCFWAGTGCFETVDQVTCPSVQFRGCK